MTTPIFDQLTNLARGLEAELKAREDALTTRESDLNQTIAHWQKTAEDFSKAQAGVLKRSATFTRELLGEVPSGVSEESPEARLKPYDRREETTVHADTNKAFKGSYYESADGSRLAWAKYNDTPDKIARRFSKLRLEVNELVRLNISFYPDLAETTKLSTGTVFALNIGGRWRIEARESDDGREVHDEDSRDSGDDGMRVSIQGNVGGFSSEKPKKKNKKRGLATRGTFGGRGATLGGENKRARTSEAKRAVLALSAESRIPTSLTPAEIEATLFEN